MITIIGFHYRKYTHYTLYGSCPPIYGIAIIRSLLFLCVAHFHESANIGVAIKCGSTVQGDTVPPIALFTDIRYVHVDECV